MSKVITINELDHQSVRFQIWDTAGQEKYRGLTPMYYRDSAAAICVFDITNADSFRSMDSWVEELHNNTADCLIAVVGNKNDLSDKEQVPYQEAKEFTTKNKTLLHMTSAKERQGIDELFVDIAKTLIERRLSKLSSKQRPPGSVQLKKPPKSGKGEGGGKTGCCK